MRRALPRIARRRALAAGRGIAGLRFRLRTRAIAGAGWNGIFSTALAEIGGPERAGSAIGVGLTGLFIAGTASPPLFGSIADAQGFSAAWTALGFFALIGLIPAVFAQRALRAARA